MSTKNDQDNIATVSETGLFCVKERQKLQALLASNGLEMIPLSNKQKKACKKQALESNNADQAISPSV